MHTFENAGVASLPSYSGPEVLVTYPGHAVIIGTVVLATYPGHAVKKDKWTSNTGNLPRTRRETG